MSTVHVKPKKHYAKTSLGIQEFRMTLQHRGWRYEGCFVRKKRRSELASGEFTTEQIPTHELQRFYVSKLYEAPSVARLHSWSLKGWRDGVQIDLEELHTIAELDELAMGFSPKVKYLGYGSDECAVQKLTPPLSKKDPNVWWRNGTHRFRQSVDIMKKWYTARQLPDEYFWRWIPAILPDHTIGFKTMNSSVSMEEEEVPWELHVHDRLRHLAIFPPYVTDHQKEPLI